MNLEPGDKMTLQVRCSTTARPNRRSASRRFSLFMYQEDLGGLTIKQLGFGAYGDKRGRIAKSTRATMVKSPEGRRNAEKVRNEFQGNVASVTRPPTVRGEHSQATLSYFKLLSGVSYDKEASGAKKPPQGTGEQPPDEQPPADSSPAPTPGAGN